MTTEHQAKLDAVFHEWIVGVHFDDPMALAEAAFEAGLKADGECQRCRELEAALKRYGKHQPNCNWRGADFKSELAKADFKASLAKCSCGFGKYQVDTPPPPTPQVPDERDRRLMLAEEILCDLSSGYWTAVLDDNDAPVTDQMGQRVLNYWKTLGEAVPPKESK